MEFILIYSTVSFALVLLGGYATICRKTEDTINNVDYISEEELNKVLDDAKS